MSRIDDGEPNGNAKVLVVCTANVCRSPIAAALLGHALAERGIDAELSSAGTMSTSLGLDPVAVEVLADRGIELTGHQPRSVTASIIRTDGADLIITMTRAHLRTVVALEPAAFGRTFTLKEMSRRAAPSPTRADWLRHMHDGRRAADLIRDHPDDDIEDPYGRGIERVRRVTDEIDGICRGLADAWPAG